MEIEKRPSYQLTPYPFGTIKEIWAISWPLMLGFFSQHLMFFVDRLLIARYSLKAMSAVAISGTAVWTILVFFVIITSISEVFVGRYNGQEKFHFLGVPVWQMIWLSIIIAPFFMLIGIMAPKWIFFNSSISHIQGEYFSILVSSGSFVCIGCALTGFFAGQGKVKIIAIISIFENFINMCLDFLLIFGGKIIPSMGAKGAAISTVISKAFAIIFLFSFFLSKKNREEKGTKCWSFHSSIFKDCLRIGIPSSLHHFLAMCGYFMFFQVMSIAGRDYITISALIQPIYVFLIFIHEGLSKGVTSICSNFIGVKKYILVWKNLFSSFKLIFLFFLIIFVIFFLFSPNIFSIFLNKEDMLILQDVFFAKKLYYVTLCLSVFFLFDGCVHVMIGMLTAAGDTRFLMVVGLIYPWLLYLGPVVIAIYFFHATINQIWIWLVIQSFIYFIILLRHYYSMSWKTQKMITTEN